MSDLQDIIATNAIQSFNQGVATGERVERERIIKLLKETDSHLIVWDTSIGKNKNRLVHGSKCGICQSIALIKGENK